MPREDARTRLVMSPPVRAARTAAFVALRPLYRRVFDRAGDPDAVLRAARFTIPGSVSQIPEEITALMAYAAEREPVRVCEIGTLYGGTTVLLSRVAPSVRLMVGIDLRVVNRRFLTGLAPRGQAVHLLEGSSQDQQTVDRLGGILDGSPLDLLFIDGGHRYEDVRADFLRYRDLVRPGGLIVFHDIVEDYGSRYGRSSGLWAGGVPRLWRELRDSYPHREFVRDPEQDAYGIGVIDWDPEVPSPA
jgi:predicted O-methyltransferase YrrM